MLLSFISWPYKLEVIVSALLSVSVTNYLLSLRWTKNSSSISLSVIKLRQGLTTFKFLLLAKTNHFEISWRDCCCWFICHSGFYFQLKFWFCRTLPKVVWSGTLPSIVFSIAHLFIVFQRIHLLHFLVQFCLPRHPSRLTRLPIWWTSSEFILDPW